MLSTAGTVQAASAGHYNDATLLLMTVSSFVLRRLQDLAIMFADTSSACDASDLTNAMPRRPHPHFPLLLTCLAADCTV